jgi:hypothetical protein
LMLYRASHNSDTAFSGEVVRGSAGDRSVHRLHHHGIIGLLSGPIQPRAVPAQVARTN